MIRKYTIGDIEAVLDIWLSASIKAHDFVPPSFWQDQVENMRSIYLPASDVYVFEKASKVVGFYALYENNLAAIFVKPEQQGQGVGKQLITHAKRQRVELTLSVYKANEVSYQFYLTQGFKVISERKDEHTGHLEYTMSLST
ncbi:GNAT family N-acetyltransferase [Vibrio parahaemolyticus]|uniref:GNAT family N-acetyltransferase n=1 Tax=Vibrio parahaemolyticus TaxID=670 RepID=UPI00236107BE|nr:GNAT family N-acetyltransferase [Vibrio parahaemolyticus]